jgi:hypothetical protein
MDNQAPLPPESPTPPEDPNTASAPSPQDTASSPPDTQEELSWEASEYIHHHKPGVWYVGFFGVGVAIATALYIVLDDWVAVAVVVVMFAALFVYGVRQPRTLRYAITSTGMDVAGKAYPFVSFRSFSLVHDQGVPSITFIPLQRFALPLTVYFAPEDADKISDALSQHLPYEEYHPDMIDRLAHYLRF